MHLSALNYGRLFFQTYCEYLPAGSKVVDIGAQNVNGSIKDVCPDNYQYIGVDFVEGKGVDVVLDDPYSLPFEDESIDAVVCSSCFEHSDMFWLVFNEILRILKPAGLLYINAPSNGYVHRWPVDCWRFYPDAGNALVTWAKRSGYDPVLLESFIGHRANDSLEGAWNDFVAVFAKSQALQEQFQKKMIHSLEGFDNARLPGSDELINFHQDPPDFRLIERLREDKVVLSQQLDHQEKAHQELAVQADDAHQQLATQMQVLAAAQDELASVRNEAANAHDEVQSLRLQLASAEEQNRKAAGEFSATIRDIHQSTSWKVTAPLRLLSRAVRGERPLVAGGLRARVLNQIKPIYWAIPPRFRTRILHWGYRNLDIVFRGSPHYEHWKRMAASHISISPMIR